MIIFEELKNSKSPLSKEIYEIYINRCNEFILNPILDFDYIYEHNSKN